MIVNSTEYCHDIGYVYINSKVPDYRHWSEYSIAMYTYVHAYQILWFAQKQYKKH